MTFNVTIWALNANSFTIILMILTEGLIRYISEETINKSRSQSREVKCHHFHYKIGRMESRVKIMILKGTSINCDQAIKIVKIKVKRLT